MELLFIYLLFSVINPIGTVPILLDLLRMMKKKNVLNFAVDRCKCFVIMIISFLGNTFCLFSISMEALRIAGGIVIATWVLTAFR
jgi:small neutral amino acid transporter SnatA (MarC family)